MFNKLIRLLQYVYGYVLLPTKFVFDTITDYTAAGSFADIAKNVKYNIQEDFAMLVRTTDLKSNFQKGNFVYVDEHAYKYLWRVQLNETSLVLPNIGNCGEVYYINPLILPYKNNVLGPNAILVKSKMQNMKYLFYILRTDFYLNQLSKIISPVGQTKFNKTEFKDILLPIPSLKKQQKIVEILDNFDKLVNDLSNGLPAEIEARQKQYEYYRDKLLNFKRKN